MNRIFQSFFLIFSFTPLIAYFLYPFIRWGVNLVLGLGGIIVFFLGCLFIRRRITFPRYVIPMIFYSFFRLAWDIHNGVIDDKGIFGYLIRNDWLHIIFVLTIIYNTTFTDSFIRIIILLIKVTIITTVIVCILQVFHDPFFYCLEQLYEYYKMKGIYEIRRASIFGWIGANEIALSFLPLCSIFIGYQRYYNRHINYLWIALMGLGSNIGH